jgi:hypothetical protein
MFEANYAAQSAGSCLVQRDRRADEGKRKVRVTRKDVVIARSLEGIAMMVSVPVRSYRGVALAVEAAAGGGAAYRLSLAHADPDLDIVLCETRDSAAVAADWKYWSSYLDLPRLSQEDGDVAPVDGAKDSNRTIERRHNFGVAGRRPRFLSRRRKGEASRTETVFAGEREIVCYE